MPNLFQIRILFLQIFDFHFQFCQTFLRCIIGVFLQCFPLNLELNDFPVQAIQCIGFGVNFDSNSTGGFVNQINRFVWQISVGNIPVRQLTGCNDSRICNIDTVMDFIFFFDAAKNRNGAFQTRLLNNNLLKPSFECRVLFNIFAVFVQRSSTDTMQFATCECRFKHIACIH